jgi:hypothetical protein
MTSPTEIAFVHFVTYSVFTFSLNPNRPDNIMFIGCLTAWFGIQYFHMVCTTLAHPKTNYHMSQFGH